MDSVWSLTLFLYRRMVECAEEVFSIVLEKYGGSEKVARYVRKWRRQIEKRGEPKSFSEILGLTIWTYQYIIGVVGSFSIGDCFTFTSLREEQEKGSASIKKEFFEDEKALEAIEAFRMTCNTILSLQPVVRMIEEDN